MLLRFHLQAASTFEWSRTTSSIIEAHGHLIERDSKCDPSPNHRGQNRKERSVAAFHVYLVRFGQDPERSTSFLATSDDVAFEQARNLAGDNPLALFQAGRLVTQLPHIVEQH
jgi:hypothetical protein